MGNVSTWFKTAAGNNTGSPPNYPIEGMAPSTVNDTMRENMAALARWYADCQGSLVTTGTGNAYLLTSNNVFSALADQPVLVFRVDRANTGAATLKVDSLTAKSLRIAGDALESGALVADTIISVAYNATDDAYDILSQINLTAGALPATIVYESRQVISGNGLTGGGDLSADRTLAVGAGNGITVNANDVALDISHGRNVQHANVDIIAGDGLTGGGDITASRTIDLGTPATVSGTSSNNASASSHTHEVSSTDSRTSNSVSLLLQAKAMDDHTSSGDHDARYLQFDPGFGAVGSYAMLYTFNTGITEGTTYAGSGLYPGGVMEPSGAGISADADSGDLHMSRGASAVAGTWRAMGRHNAFSGSSRARICLFMRTA